MPLVRGRYPVSNPLWASLGQATNIANTSQPIRSNAEWFGLAGITDQAAATITAKANGVAVPVDVGMTITKVGFAVGATAAATSTHTNVALYAGGLAAPTKLGTQSTDNTAGNGGFPASAWNLITLGGGGYTVTATDAPAGYIYVSLGITATTQPSLAGWSTPAAVFYTWSALNSATTNPLFFNGAYTGGGAAAPATLATGAVTAVVPLVVLL